MLAKQFGKKLPKVLVSFVKQSVSYYARFRTDNESSFRVERMPRLNIYFCGSMRAGRQDVDLYGILVDKLQQANMAIGFSFFCFLLFVGLCK